MIILNNLNMLVILMTNEILYISVHEHNLSSWHPSWDVAAQKPQPTAALTLLITTWPASVFLFCLVNIYKIRLNVKSFLDTQTVRFYKNVMNFKLNITKIHKKKI